MPHRAADPAGATFRPGLTGHTTDVPLLSLGLLLPFVLLLLMMSMERVERPLRIDSVSEELENFLDTARPEEVEVFVSQGYAEAMERYWKRRRITRLLPAVLPGRTRV